MFLGHMFLSREGTGVPVREQDRVIVHACLTDKEGVLSFTPYFNCHIVNKRSRKIKTLMLKYSPALAILACDDDTSLCQ